MIPAIRLTDVTKRFGAIAAVDRLTLSVPEGSIYGFIGPNGSGKTTTLRMIMHILLPDEGQIEVLGTTDTAAARDRAIDRDEIAKFATATLRCSPLCGRAKPPQSGRPHSG